MDDARLRDLLESHKSKMGGLIRGCRSVMQCFGFISETHTSLLADVFNVSLAEVRGIVSFYHDFRTKPAAKQVVRICQAEACQALGARQLTAEVEQALSTSMSPTSDSVKIGIEPVYCLGLCSIGPAVEVNGTQIARATVDSVQSELA